MNWKNSEWFLCIFILICGLQIIIGARQNPLKDPKICGRPECDYNDENSKFKYSSSVKYTYDYSLHIRTEFFGIGQNTSDLYLKSKVNLVFPKRCEGMLKITNVELREKLTDSSESTAFIFDDYGDDYTEAEDPDVHAHNMDLAKALENNELRFSFHDGAIDEVCPILEEPAWVLNLKKGILSSFQNTMLRFDVDLNTTEVDVSGNCEVAYSLHGAEDTHVIISKYKNIATCKNRNKMHSFLHTTPYSFRDDKSIWPILNSESYCNISVDHNIYDSVQCYERHQLIPFSNNKTGAVTISDAKFKLTGEVDFDVNEYFADEDKHIVRKRSGLDFDHTPTVKPTHGEIKAARDLLKQMCNLGFPNIQREFIDTFTKFLETIRLLSYKALHQLLTRSSSICEKGKNHILESLPYVGTTESYQLMRDQIVNEEIPKEVAQSWMNSMAFIKRPDEETLETFYTILDYGQKKTNPEFTLGATAVVYAFCQHNSNCEDNEKVLRIVQHLETEYLRLLQSNLNERRVKERLTIILKGLGNIGIMTKDFTDNLKKLIRIEVDLPVELRLEAVLSFRRTNCIRHREFFLDIYQTFTTNSEIRIFSYLQAMRCPDYLSISAIKNVLETEEVNQVGSYVWSHLTNLAKSASPVRVEAQGLLINDNLGTKYKMDIRKFSRNYEYSLFFDEYNFGTDIDANLIFGTDSYLPRILTLNLTADLFGESVNFFEITARTQGFEQIVSSIFGPNGPFNAEIVRKKFGFLNKFFGDDSSERNDVEEFINLDKLRIKRSSDDYNFEEDHESESSEENGSTSESQNVNDSEAREQKIKTDVDKLGYNLKYNYNEPKAAIGFRTFGNDLHYLSINGMSEALDIAQKMNPLLLARKFLSGQKITYSKSGVFLDASFNVPLSSGLPLSIHAFGASSVDMRLSGDLKQSQGPEGINLDIEGKLKPSVSVDILTTMESDFFYAKSGIRMKSNLFSSSSVEAKLKIRGSNLVSLTFGLPQDKNEIFSAKSELLVFKENEEISQAGIEKRSSNTTCTWSVLDLAIGLKICSHYSVPDVSGSSLNNPGVLLSGPIDLNVQLEKTDPGAKTFVFEYRWDTVDNTTEGSFKFETPGSAVRRVLTATIKNEPDAFNASLGFLLGGGEHSAVALYKSEPNDKRLEFYIESNGKKNFALDLKMNSTAIKNGQLYTPSCLLYVKDEIVAGMKGTFKITSKNGVLQNDINLNFETKKLQAKLYGNYQRTEITSSVKLAMDYRFEENKIEKIEFEGKMSNKGGNIRTEYDGALKLKTTAHPNFNFASTMTWLSLLAHTEAKITFNNAEDFVDPHYMTTLRLVFARIEPEKRQDPFRARAMIELTRPKSNIDFRIQLKHEEIHKKGVVHNLLLGLRYAPQKEATGFLSLYLPQRKYLHVDANLNISVPDFDSCTVRLKLIEQNPKNYTIDFRGAWFNKHSVAFNGFYANRGSRNYPSYHQLKLFITSPLFENTLIDLIYRRNSLEIFTDLQATYNEIPYGLTLKLSSLGIRQKNSYAELKLHDKVYWLSSKLFTRENKLLVIEIHLDKVRDIHIKITGVRSTQKKELSVEIKWDANRDPSQRLALLGEFNNPDNSKYDGTLMLTYPDRTFSCGFQAFTGGPQYNGTARVSWNTNEALVLNYNAGFITSGNVSDSYLSSELKTPFEGWRQNQFDAGIYLANNMILVNSTLLWAENQFFGIKYKSDYSITNDFLKCELLLGVNSSVPDVPTVSAYLKHKHDVKNINTDANFRYTNSNQTTSTYNIHSDWRYEKNHNFKNISGAVHIRTPIENYQRNGLVLIISLGENREVQAAAKMNFEKRKFLLSLNGYVKKFTDNMLQVNVTTPFPKFEFVTGRFGLQEKKRHAVAEISAPIGAIGGEILLAINSISDFDIKLSAASPIEGFKRIALVAKLKPDTTDWRGTWNNITLGFTGVWRMEDYSDFEYSYMVFTGFKEFKENGIIIKFLNHTDEFIYMVYGKLSMHKLGLKISGNPRPQIINTLGSKQLYVQLLDDEEYQLPVNDVEEDSEEDDYEYFNLEANIELDVLIYPTITGSIDIQETSDYYFTTGHIQLPQGDIEFADNVYYPDMLQIKNVLVLKTPFPFAKDVKSKFEYNLDFGSKYIGGLEISYFGDEWTSVGYMVNYTIVNETDVRTRDLKVTLKTPFKLLPRIDINGYLETEDTIYRANFTTKTSDTLLSVGGSVESDENFLETIFGLTLKSPTVPLYGMNFQLKRDLSAADKQIELGFEIRNDKTLNKMKIDTKWIKDDFFLDGKSRLTTNILPLKVAEISILATRNPSPLLSFDLTIIDNNNESIEYKGMASRKRDLVNVEISTPIKEFRNISLSGTLNKMSEPNEFRLVGELSRNNKIFYNIDGPITLDSDFPIKVYLVVKPKTNGPSGVIEFSLTDTPGNYGKTFRFNSIEDGKMCQINGGYTIISFSNWEISTLVQSTEMEISRISFNTKLKQHSQGIFESNFNLETPWRNLGIENIHVNANLNIGENSGRIEGDYDIQNLKGRGFFDWTWILLENMKISAQNVFEKLQGESKMTEASAHYINPNKNFQRFLAGARLNVDNLWELDVNSSLKLLSQNDMFLGFVATLPEPIRDVHRLNARYRGNFIEYVLGDHSNPIDVFAETNYESDDARRRLSSRMSYRNIEDIQGIGRIQWGIADEQNDVVEGNFQILRKSPARKEFFVKLITPFYKDEDSFFANGNYDNKNGVQMIVCSLNSPASRQLLDADVNFFSMNNAKGHLNITNPFYNESWIRGDFDFNTKIGDSLRFLRITWPTNSAFVKMQSKFSSKNLDRDLQGTVTIEVPLATNHYAEIEYGLKERDVLNTGYGVVTYNNEKVLNGQYSCKTEERAGFAKDVVDITLENNKTPIGIHYVHSKQYTDTEYPDYDMKHLEIFVLRDEKNYNITGELHIRSTQTGQEYKIIAIHPNRTVIWNSDYDCQGEKSRQTSKLELSPAVWIGYRLETENRTTSTNESQNFIAELFYPKRTLSAEGWYYFTKDIFDSDIGFRWKNNRKEEKTVKAGLLWKNELLIGDGYDHQTAILSIGHPSFLKDITFKGLFYRSPSDLLKAELVIDYFTDPRHIVKVYAFAKDLTPNVGFYNYITSFEAEHPISDLKVKADGSISIQQYLFETKNTAFYKRGYYPDRNGLVLAKLDLVKKEIEYERQSPYKTLRFWFVPHSSYPIYGFNASVCDSPDLNGTGYFFIDLNQKFTRMEFNLTPDASQNIQMIGQIPDARGAYFDLWRNYEEFRVIDISSYIRMNHSRLVTGQFHWRPKMKTEIKEKFRNIGASFYESFSDGIDFWIKTMYEETIESINDVWYNAKEKTSSFLNDFSELKVLEEDINDLRKFMNSSYESNDFYIKTAINFTLGVLDELAIRDRIESLPKILNEIWQAMGDSGKALRKSILWLIETIKTSYHHALEAISKFFQGQSLDHLSKLMQRAVERYDKFVKDLHISFIKYVENLWTKISNILANYWKLFLKRIEPHIFRFIHYIESAAWNMSKEVFDFIYNRTNEIAESPYFNQVSSVTQDIDRLYKDITANDAITNFKKYSAIAWEFLKEKYFKLVPFGKELNDVFTELWEEIQSLQKLPQFKLVLNKIYDMQAKINWLADELQLERRIHQLWELIRKKIGSYTLTALETDEMYREAKTLFVFDPEVGIIDLQQKLPMSWHAFNETPKFEEIPEYKAIADMQNFFGGTNFSLVGWIYTVRTHLDPRTWLPPYSAHSLLIGSRHYMTFDNNYVKLNVRYDITSPGPKRDQCSYVLAHDFFQKNFTLLSEPSILERDGKKITTRKLSLIATNKLIEIDVTSDTLRIGNNNAPTLPVKVNDMTIYRDTDILIIESDQGFTLNCNLQFDLCWFELGSWYFGQTAGVLGTMNNEVFDDKLTSKNLITNEEDEFINSWSLNQCIPESQNDFKPNNRELEEICHEFFGTAYFSSCFEELDPKPFHQMCLDLGANSISTVLKENHPTQMGACTTALAYIEACDKLKIPLRVPEKCVHCTLMNGTYVAEGTFVEIDTSQILQTTDVVFIVEAKPCNSNLTTSKSIMTLVSAINRELLIGGLTNNRYSVLTYGGREPFDKPRSVVHKNKIFTSNIMKLKTYFDHIEAFEGPNNDIFGAISSASKSLIFRPGASKTFILLPCSSCNPKDMRFDYSAVLQLMLDEGINLHILLDKEFTFSKPRLDKVFFGLDRDLAYSKRDTKDFRGDNELRRQVHPPKGGYFETCIALAIESNGSVFAGKKLRPLKNSPVKKFSTIFAKRIAKTARPNSCQICECNGHNTGIAYMICTNCNGTSSEESPEDFDPREVNFDWSDDDDDIIDDLDESES